MAGWIAIFFFSSVLLGVGTVAAAPDDAVARLEWSAPPSCPTQEVVRAKLRELLDPTVVPPPVHVRADVDPGPSSTHVLRVTVSGRGQPSERTFTSDDCEELAAAAAIVAAIAIDPLGVATRIEDTSPPQQEPAPPAPAVEPPEEPRARPVPTTRTPAVPGRPSPPHWALHLAAGPLWSEQPVPTATLQVFAARGFGLLAVRFGAEGWFPQRFVDPHIPAPETETGIWAGRLLGRLEGCLRPGRKRLLAPVCLGLNGGGVLARAYGVPGRQTRASFSSSVLGNVGLLWRPVGGRLGLFLAVEGAVQLTKARFHIGTRGSGYVGSPLSGSFVAGVEIGLDRPK